MHKWEIKQRQKLVGANSAPFAAAWPSKRTQDSSAVAVFVCKASTDYYKDWDALTPTIVDRTPVAATSTTSGFPSLIVGSLSVEAARHAFASQPSCSPSRSPQGALQEQVNSANLMHANYLESCHCAEVDSCSRRRRSSLAISGSECKVRSLARVTSGGCSG